MTKEEFNQQFAETLATIIERGMCNFDFPDDLEIHSTAIRWEEDGIRTLVIHLSHGAEVSIPIDL